MASDLTPVEHTQTHFKRNLLISGNYDLCTLHVGWLQVTQDDHLSVPQFFKCQMLG